jgi:hypothetical protein
MPAPCYKKILKYWKANLGNSAQEPSKLQMDVTALRCEEEDDNFQLLDETGRVLAEFGPGKQYDGWLLTVEYSTRR